MHDHAGRPENQKAANFASGTLEDTPAVTISLSQLSCTESLASNTWDRRRFFGIHGGFEMIQGCTGSWNIIACNNMLEFGNLNSNLSCKVFEEKTPSSRMVFANYMQTCAFVFGSQVNQRRNKTIPNNLCNIISKPKFHGTKTCKVSRNHQKLGKGVKW